MTRRVGVDLELMVRARSSPLGEGYSGYGTANVLSIVGRRVPKSHSTIVAWESPFGTRPNAVERAVMPPCSRLAEREVDPGHETTIRLRHVDDAPALAVSEDRYGRIPARRSRHAWSACRRSPRRSRQNAAKVSARQAFGLASARRWDSAAHATRPIGPSMS
jgi:hypothetical protein